MVKPNASGETTYTPMRGAPAAGWRPRPARQLTPPTTHHAVYRSQVLFIDDEPSICTAMRLLLNRHGFDVCVAMTVEAARAEVLRTRFDAVVLDYWLQNDAGYSVQRGDEVFRGLVELDPALVARTIFVTGDPCEETRCRMERTSAQYLFKPFEIGLLVNALRAMIRSEGVRLVPQADQSSRFA